MGSLSDAPAAAAGAPICVRAEHYPDPVPVGPLTADFRLHDTTDGQLCIAAPDPVSAPALRFWETSTITGKPRVRRRKKLYRTIVVDPPWSFNNFNPFANTKVRGTDAGDRRAVLSRQKYRKGAAAVYECMTLHAIRELPIGNWAEPDAHLYIWTPGTFIEEAHALAREWGFMPKQPLVWNKPRLGLGMYYRNTAEFVVFAVRGHLRCLRRDVGTVFEGDQGPHSQKPDSFYDRTESMSPGPYLDVFARKHRFGWDVFGNEVYNEPELLETLTDAQREGLIAKEGTHGRK